MAQDGAASLPISESLASNLAAVREQVEVACARVGRDPAGVTIVGVSKTQTNEAVAAAVRAGLIDLGENRAQELVQKATAAAGAGLHPRWHFIGHLQRNKVGLVLPHITVLHSLDSQRLAEELQRECERQGVTDPLPCYLEVNVGGEASKQGITPDALSALLVAVAGLDRLRVVGLMTVAPQAPDPEQLRPLFRHLRELADAEGLDGLSMGMTEDYPVAIEEGATMVRIGRAIFGERRA